MQQLFTTIPDLDGVCTSSINENLAWCNSVPDTSLPALSVSWPPRPRFPGSAGVSRGNPNKPNHIMGVTYPNLHDQRIHFHPFENFLVPNMLLLRTVPGSMKNHAGSGLKVFSVVFSGFRVTSHIWFWRNVSATRWPRALWPGYWSCLFQEQLPRHITYDVLAASRTPCAAGCWSLVSSQQVCSVAI